MAKYTRLKIWNVIREAYPQAITTRATTNQFRIFATSGLRFMYAIVAIVTASETLFVARYS